MAKKTGKVYIVGTGPGDPGLITVRAYQVIQKADTLVYDSQVNPLLLREARPEAELIYAGKSATPESFSQADINALLVRLAQDGKIVARLKGGDPLAFSRGAEEAQALQNAGIAFEIVPGISSAIAAPAYAGIPITHKAHASSFTVASTYADTPKESEPDYDQLATLEGTLVFMMSVSKLSRLTVRLIEAGKSPATPTAIVRQGTTWQQKTIVGTLGNIAQLAQEAGITPPAVIIVGDVVTLREKLQWWDKPETRPLLGKRIVVTRAREQASTLLGKLIDLGADAIEFPTIQIIDPADYAPMDAAITHLDSYDWIVFTSVNGVDYFIRRMKLAGKDARTFGKAKVCAIGPATAAALETANIKADFVPSKYVAESILEELGEVRGKRILLARADVAREALLTGLLEQGAEVDQVTAYRQVIAQDKGGPTEARAADLVNLLENGEIDLVTFTSSNTVRNFATRLATASSKPLAQLLDKTLVACIGPITAGTARELGLKVDLEATEFTIDKLVETVVNAYRNETVGAIS